MIKTLLRGAAWTAGLLALLAVALWLYYLSLELDRIPKANPQATLADVAFVQRPVAAQRGRILAIVSSTERMRDGHKMAGYELTELSRAYYVFQANGYQVDVASPRGGKPPARIDYEDMGDIDYAFLNDRAAQHKVDHSLALAEVDPTRYAAVYFVGGKGAVFDLPGNPEVARIVRSIGERGVIGAICHGPAALVDVTMTDGTPLLAGRRVTGTTSAEELFLMSDARTRLPFLIEDRMREARAWFDGADLFMDNTVVDGRLVTGQNPWSTWSTAEAMLAALGHTPVMRQPTAEEVSVRLLSTYRRAGLDAARAQKTALPRADKMLLLMHALVAAMQWELHDAFQLQRLAQA